MDGTGGHHHVKQSKPGSESQSLHLFSHIRKIYPKDNHVHKHKHDYTHIHTYIYMHI
jgi:hypothetical protein